MPTGRHGRGQKAVATLRVLDGPDAGRSSRYRAAAPPLVAHALATCACTIHCLKTHARIVVGETVELIDAGSANGILVDDDLADRFVLGRDHTAVLGDTPISVVLHLAGSDDGSGSPRSSSTAPPA